MVEEEFNYDITKEEEKIIVRIPQQEEELKILKDSKEVVMGKDVFTNKFIFENKQKALEYYDIQYNNCVKGTEHFQDLIKKLESEINKGDELFEQIYKLKDKITKGKTKLLDEYIQKSIEYNYSKNQIKLREKDSKLFKQVIDKIKEL